MANKKVKQSKSGLNRQLSFSLRQVIAFVAVFAAVGGFTIYKSFASPSYSLILNQTNPKVGDTITFTGTFPKEAFRQAHNPQFHQNPYLTIQCGNTTSTVLRQSTSFFKSGSNPDGSLNGTATAYLLANSGNGITWPTGVSATCSASSGYWTDSNKTGGVTYNPVANLMFNVTP